MYTLLAIVDNTVVEVTTHTNKADLDMHKALNDYDLHGVEGYWASYGSPMVRTHTHTTLGA